MAQFVSIAETADDPIVYSGRSIGRKSVSMTTFVI
jgi:hypothetical protein